MVEVPGIKVSITQVPGMNGSLLEVRDVTVFVVVSGMAVFVAEFGMRCSWLKYQV